MSDDRKAAERRVGLARLWARAKQIVTTDPTGSDDDDHVVDEEAARVLVGHDLSAGGMRVAPNPALFVGQQLRVALYGSPGETPLVVDARVIRDDGERGLVLHFGTVPESAARYLEKLLDVLPILDGGRSPAPGLVVSEILDADEA